ncbi:MAG TPA: hypothetical protein DIU35_05275 [Candidatus Latescibacteria bacterium]|nr:hypothetical protein [Gemmatimonadota bacterium]HCR16875.1 hypothetical protein [Candidatus Latescibacterota bacterium]
MSGSLEISAQPMEGPERRGVTLRSIGLGVVVATGSSLWVNYVEYVIHASRQMTGSHFPIGALMAYLSVVLVLNPFCRRLATRYALSVSELMVVLACGLVGGTIPSVGLTGYMLGAIAAPFYFANPENQWGDYFHPHIPKWLAPRNENGALDYLFEGLPSGETIPWQEWYIPIACWLSLVAALFVASLCIAVILRKQWVVSERLTYPVLTPVMELTTRSKRGDYPRLFKIGFYIAFGIMVWNMVNYFVPGFPKIPNIQWGPWIKFERYFPGVWTRINLFIISFAYFANTDILFSLWFFDLVFILRSGILNRLGYNASSWAHASGNFAWIPLGAFFSLVFWSLWVARGHLKAVVKTAMGKFAGLDESQEMMGYRTALLGLGASVVFVVLWFWQAGMEMGMSCLLVFTMLVLYLGVARIVCDVGLVFVSMPVGAQRFVTSILGTRNITGSSFTVLAFTNGLYSYGKGLFLPALSQMAKVADFCPKGDRRKVLAGVFVAFATAVVATIVFTLYLGYRDGAYNFNDYPFNHYSKYGYTSALSQMKNPQPPNATQLGLFGIGVISMSTLTFLKYRFAWWPFHPIGFALSGTSTYVRYGVFSVFLAWAIKFFMLRMGGATMYRRYQPFFLGVLTGYTAGITLSLFVDIIWFPGGGHSIHGY